jgi:hypothetical protein
VYIITEEPISSVYFLLTARDSYVKIKKMIYT